MEREGPVLETLTRRLAETPEDFLAEPRIGGAGRVHTAAVVGDLLRALGGAAGRDELLRFGGADARTDRNRLSITQVLCWLLADEWFVHAAPPAAALLPLLSEQPAELAEQSAAGKFVTDPDRREELARLALARLGYRPAGETQAQAQDRLTTLSSAERARVLRAARLAEQRARELREALIRKAAEESADKWGRE
jgi:hypothetical protein